MTTGRDVTGRTSHSLLYMKCSEGTRGSWNKVACYHTVLQTLRLFGSGMSMLSTNQQAMPSCYVQLGRQSAKHASGYSGGRQAHLWAGSEAVLHKAVQEVGFFCVLLSLWLLRRGVDMLLGLRESSRATLACSAGKIGR